MEKKLISVIMPVFNSEKYIEKSIKSVLEQTYDNIELIIINDCSTDNTEQIVNNIKKSDKRILYLKNNYNIGVSQSRNFGIQMSNGEWIAFLDSDDLWEKDKLKKQMDYIEENINVQFLCTGSSFIDKDDKKFDYKFNVPSKIDYNLLLKQNLISCSSVLIKKELVLHNPMPTGFIHEDYATWLKILKKIDYAYGINEPLLVYRIRINSKSGNKFKSIIMNWNTYRYMRLNLFQQIWYMMNYVIRNLRKYYKIR